jgi:hypothetical protein
MSGDKRVGSVMMYARCVLVFVVVLGIVAGGNVSSHAETTFKVASSTKEPATTTGTVSVLTWAAVLSAVAALVLLFSAGFSVFVIWGLLFQVATADTEGRAAGGTAGGIWNGEFPRADQIPREGD